MFPENSLENSSKWSPVFRADQNVSGTKELKPNLGRKQLPK